MVSQLEPGTFFPTNGFQDDVHGEILLSTFEQACVDTPEFQRLFRITQLGFIDFVFQTANHTRGVHSIGVCHVAQKLLDALRVNEQGTDCKAPPISQAEVILIRAGALLHDISHGPFSHDIEKKRHKLDAETVTSAYGKYPKHDDWKENPILFLLLFDRKQSVLARVLSAFSKPFGELIRAEATGLAHIRVFNDLLRTHKIPDDVVLPQLLFHLLAFENERDAQSGTISLRESFENNHLKDWHLGWQSQNGVSPEVGLKLHKAWYQPYRHDIIGNTLSADLLDYLLRDIAHMNLGRGLDLHLLKDYCRVPSRTNETYRCAINLWDRKRGIHKPEVLNDLFRLLDLRHEIHAKAVFHRMALAATAMLSRALTNPHGGVELKELFWSSKVSSALMSDDYFLAKLSHGLGANDKDNIVAKIAERRFYRPLALMSATQLTRAVSLPPDKTVEFAGIIDSTYYSSFLLFISWCVERYLRYAWRDEPTFRQYLKELSRSPDRLEVARKRIGKRIIVWTTPYKQLHKSPDILVNSDDGITSILELAGKQIAGNPAPLADLAKSSLDSAEKKYAELWKVYVFMDDSLFADNVLTKRICGADADYSKRLEEARIILSGALHAVWQHWQAKRIHDAGTSLNAPCPAKQFEQLITLFEDVHIPDGISTLKLADYGHETGSDATNSKCRDIRHRFPYEQEQPTELEMEFTEILKRVKLVPKSSDREAMVELTPRYELFKRDPRFAGAFLNEYSANRGDNAPTALADFLTFDLP